MPVPVIVLTNEQVRDLMPIAAYVDAIEAAYREYGLGRAVNQTRIDLYGESPGENQYCVFKSMVGMLPKDHVVALRINSDVISWTRREGNLRKEKIPAAEGGRWVGLVFIFDTLTGELRGIMPDGEVQRRRVGATTAVAVRHLARPGARTVGIYGSGSQAEGAVIAIAAALPNCEIRVWSPSQDNRRALAQRCRGLGINIEAMDSREQPALGADVVITATNALDRVVEPEWIGPGAVVACVKAQELGRDILAGADRIILHTHDLDPINYVAGKGNEPFRDTDFVDTLFGATRGDGDVRDLLKSLAVGTPDLADVVSGRVAGRTKAEERIVFLNPVGTGLQFAAVAKHILDAAERQKIGERLPTGWFTEDMHP
jgi:ornithine cyclodeaminase/alanine dehydrogenase-like protein (mu-crystallin family)